MGANKADLLNALQYAYIELVRLKKVHAKYEGKIGSPDNGTIDLIERTIKRACPSFTKKEE